MNGFKLSLVCAIAACSFVLPTFAVVNQGFESGDFTDWTDNGGPKSVVTSYTEPDGIGQVYAPANGSYFAVLTSGLIDDQSNPIYSTLSQTFALAEDEIVSGSAAFDAGDIYLPDFGLNDDAYVKIQGAFGTTTLWSKDIAAVGDYGNSMWELWSFQAPSAGLYTLTYGVRNAGDNAVDSTALFDAPEFTQVSVPDNGSTLFLLGSSLIVLFGLNRRTPLKV